MLCPEGLGLAQHGGGGERGDGVVGHDELLRTGRGVEFQRGALDVVAGHVERPQLAELVGVERGEEVVLCVDDLERGDGVDGELLELVVGGVELAQVGHVGEFERGEFVALHVECGELALGGGDGEAGIFHVDGLQ